MTGQHGYRGGDRARRIAVWIVLPLVAAAVAVYCSLRFVQNHQMLQHGRFGSVLVQGRTCTDGECHLRVHFGSLDRQIQRDVRIGDHDWELRERHRAYYDARTGRIRTVGDWDPVANGMALGASAVVLVTLGGAALAGRRRSRSSVSDRG